MLAVLPLTADGRLAAAVVEAELKLQLADIPVLLDAVPGAAAVDDKGEQEQAN